MNRQVISVGDVEFLPRFCWRVGLVVRLIYGKDSPVRGTVVRVLKARREISRPVNKLYPIESIENRKKEMIYAKKNIVT